MKLSTNAKYRRVLLECWCDDPPGVGKDGRIGLRFMDERHGIFMFSAPQELVREIEPAKEGEE